MLQIHWTKHTATYFENLNKAIVPFPELQVCAAAWQPYKVHAQHGLAAENIIPIRSVLLRVLYNSCLGLHGLPPDRQCGARRHKL